MADNLDSAKGRWAVLALAVLVLAAVAVRLFRLQCAATGLDGAVCGLLGLGVLEGRWPIFFWGQDFMGALDGYLAAPVYALFGPSSLALNIWPPIFNLATVGVIYAMLRRRFTSGAALVGLAYLAVPPALVLYHLSKPSNHYPLGLLLSALLMWLSLRLAPERPWRVSTAFWWGLVGGLALWTNFQTVTVIWPCMLFLALTGLAGLRPLPLLAGVAGAALGAGPLLWFDLGHAWVHAQQGGSFAVAHFSGNWQHIFYNSLPLVLGFDTPAAGGAAAPGHPLFLLYLAVLAAAGAGGLLLIWRARAAGQRWALLPLMVIASTLAVLAFSVYGQDLGRPDQRQMQPLYLALPFCWAALAQGLAGRGDARRRWLAPALAVGLMALAVAGWPGFRDGLLMYWQNFNDPVEASDKLLLAKMRHAGLRNLYHVEGRAQYRMAFFGEENPQIASFFRDRRLYAANQVDADPAAAFLDPPGGGLDFLGLDYQVWEGRVLHGFTPPQGADRLLPRAGWRVEGPGRGLIDGDLETGWRIAPGGDPGPPVVVDLGREETAGGLALVPYSHRHGPGLGLRVEAAGEDGAFSEIRTMHNDWQPVYWSAVHPFLKVRYPRTECYFPPRPIRYLRLTQTRPRQSPHEQIIGELMVLGPGQADAALSWVETARRVEGLARQGGAARIYADAWLSAWLDSRLGQEVAIVPPNFTTDDYGAVEPSPEEPLALVTAPGSLLVVPRGEAEQAVRALSRAGVGFRRVEAGRASAFWLLGGEPLEAAPLAAVTSEIDPAAAAGLARGYGDGGRWGSRNPQRPGMALTVELARPAAVAGVRLLCPDYPLDHPRGLALEVSDDGHLWRPAPSRLTAPLAFSGRGVFAVGGPVTEHRLDQPVRARFLRLSLVRPVDPWWWSVQRLEVLAAP